MTLSDPSSPPHLSQLERSPALDEHDEHLVEIWGLANAGKRALLASLCTALIDFGIECEIHADGRNGERLGHLLGSRYGHAIKPHQREEHRERSAGARLEFALPGADRVTRQVQVAVRDASEVSGVESHDPSSRDRQDKIMVICVNPFLADANVAWKGLQQMLAALQCARADLTLPLAMQDAVDALFGCDVSGFVGSSGLDRLLNEAADIRVRSDVSRPEDREAFVWNRHDGTPSDPVCDAVKKRVEEWVSQSVSSLEPLRRALRDNRQSVVALTRIDLIDAAIPAITFSDLERVFDQLFAGQPSRHIGQQVAARLFYLEALGRKLGTASPPPAESVVDGDAMEPPRARPFRPLSLRHDGGVRIMEYLHSSVGNGRADNRAAAETKSRPRRPATPGERGLTPAESSDDSFAADAAGVASAVEQERQRGQRKVSDLKRMARAAVAERDAAITRLRKKVRDQERDVQRLTARAHSAAAGSLSPEESEARDAFERGRIGVLQAWTVLLLRSAIAFPICAAGIYGLAGALMQSGGLRRGWLFAASGLVALAALALASLVGLGAAWSQLGPRWIWLRRISSRTSEFMTLTSGGEAVAAPALDFTLELSPLLSCLGIAIVRHNATQRKYVTTEPAVWLATPQRPRIRRTYLWDALVVGAVGAWLAASILLLMWT